MKIKNQHNTSTKKISSLYSLAKTILIALLSFGFGVALVLSGIPGYIKANFALLQNQETLLSFIEKNDLQSLDIDISYEEASFIKETFMEQYECREITLIPQKHLEEMNSDLDIHSLKV